MAEQGGLFMPMYRREAIWINFKANAPFAVKVYVGSVNAAYGQLAIEAASTTTQRQALLSKKSSIQDYLVIPSQRWLDGISTSDGIVKQFVAMELQGGLQIEVVLGRASLIDKLTLHIRELHGRTLTIDAQYSDTMHDIVDRIYYERRVPIDDQRLITAVRQAEGWRTVEDYKDLLLISNYTIYLVQRLRGGGGGPMRAPDPRTRTMGIAAGGMIKQAIIPDLGPVSRWLKQDSVVFNIQILEAADFEQVTRIAAPPTPITVETYAKQGLPFYKLYEEPSDVSGDFDNVKSIKTMDGIDEPTQEVGTKPLNSPAEAEGWSECSEKWR